MKIKEVIIVEGKYDKIKLDSIIDAFVIVCDGFGIFRQKEKMNMLRSLAEKRGIIIFTDSDSGGFKIRSYIKGCIDNKYIKNAYIPDVFGKEKRKSKPGKEGKLGVEGIEKEIILKALSDAGATVDNSGEDPVTAADLYELGLYGRDNSHIRRAEFQAQLDLPRRLSKRDLLMVINSRFTREEFADIFRNFEREN